jgi:hypothetical protein
VRLRVSAALLLTLALVAILGWTGQRWAQTKLARIGFLTPANGGPREEFVEALRKLSYVEGQRRQFRRPADRATDQIRARDQPQNCEDPWTDFTESILVRADEMIQ